MLQSDLIPGSAPAVSKKTSVVGLSYARSPHHFWLRSAGEQHAKYSETPVSCPSPCKGNVSSKRTAQTKTATRGRGRKINYGSPLQSVRYLVTVPNKWREPYGTTQALAPLQMGLF